jgi:pyruvate dehydrogenase E1 component
MGDGEMDEPESMGAIGMAGRERLDNLIFVINCNLQRLDGPVRGNGKIIQELESDFRGAGWNVIKVIWGSYWDPLLAQDKTGLLQKRMMECVDGDYQTFKARDGAYVREHFFGKYPELLKMVSTWSDDDIWRLNRGGHDPHKVYAAYAAAVAHKGQPTVILAKTIKGYGMGEAGEAQNITHQQKKMGTTSIKAFRDRFKLPVKDEELEALPYLTFPEGSKELNYMRERRMALGGYLPSAGARPSRCRCRHCRPSTPCSRRAARAASSPPRCPSCAPSTSCSRTRSSASAWCPSWSTNRAPSAWKACSARSASGTRTARTTCRRTPTR